MKLWQLMSIMRGELGSVREAAAAERDWLYIVGWIDDYGRIVSSQDRAKLDHALPIELVRTALGKSKLKFYLSGDHLLRSKRHSFFDKTLSALEAFDRFGGDALEEALEYGSVSV